MEGKKGQVALGILVLIVAIVAMIIIFSDGNSEETGQQAPTAPEQETGQQENSNEQDSGPTEKSNKDETIKFGLPPWPGVTVKTEVAKQVLEEEGYSVEQSQLDAGIVYQELSNGNLDALLAGWLPVTHQDYWNEHGDSLDRVRANMPNTWLGLAVPDYTYEDEGIQSISDLQGNEDLFGGEVTGIDPGAGVMESTEQAMENYSLESYELVDSSEPAMMASLDSAIKENEHEVVTLWEPHGAFVKFDIKKLDDPKGIYGGGDKTYTVARQDFKDDHPQVYEFFEKFNVSADSQSEWILEYSTNDREPEKVASEWISNNQDKVDSWTSHF